MAGPLQWDATSKRYAAKRGETNAHFAFGVTNVSTTEVIVRAVRPSCDCTTARTPALPWRLAPDERGQVEVNVNLRDRHWSFNELIVVETSAGTNLLALDVQLPEPTPREKNRLVAFADRQAVFKMDCAKCHLEPAAGKKAGELYKAICAICHEAEQRADMVPDLAKVKQPADKNYWDRWVRYGKPGTFMPAFSKPYGGPLNEEEILPFVNFLAEHFSKRSAAPALPPVPRSQVTR